MTNKLTTTGRWWMLWLTVGFLMWVGIFSIGKCSAQVTTFESLEDIVKTDSFVFGIESNDSLIFETMDYDTTQNFIYYYEEPAIYLSDMKAYIDKCSNDTMWWTKFHDWVDLTKITTVDSTMIDYEYFTINYKEPTFKGFYEYLNKTK